jgi:hypothetical protein
MVSATRTDEIGKELVAVVHDLAEYRFATGRLSHRVLPNADRNTRRFQNLKMAVIRKVEERSNKNLRQGCIRCEAALPCPQDLYQALPARTVCVFTASTARHESGHFT